MRNYYDKIGSMQTNKIEPALYNVDQCLMRSTFGEIPDDLTFEWNPLRQMSEAELAEIDKTRSDAIAKLDSPAVSAETLYQIQKGWGWFEGTGIDNFAGYQNSTVIEEQV